MKKVFTVIGTIIVVYVFSLFIAAQEIKTQKMLLCDDAFQAILQFYQYDKDIPLDEAVVEKEDREGYVREKIAFRGAHDYRIPGYLAIPKTGAPPYPCVLQIHGMTLSKEDFWRSDSS